jgi:hypothetical protein
VTTPNDLIQLALKDSGAFGVGMPPLAEDTNDAFTRLNLMLDEWQRERYHIWHLIDVAKVSTGAVSYTIGAGGDINVTRPDRIEAAYLRQLVQSQPNQLDYPLRVIESREEYSRIALKSLTTFPRSVFYDSAFPLGVVYPYPVMQTTIYELHLILKEVLAEFATLNQAIVLPKEYFSAIHLNLAVRLRMAYDLPDKPVLSGLARNSLKVIRDANAQIPQLVMPTDLTRNGIYNVFSDQIN